MLTPAPVCVYALFVKKIQHMSTPRASQSMSATEHGVGYAAMACVALTHVPQIAHTYRLKSAREISWGFVGTNVAVSCLCATYAWIIDKLPLLLANTICFANTMVLACMKCVYDRRARQRTEPAHGAWGGRILAAGSGNMNVAGQASSPGVGR